MWDCWKAAFRDYYADRNHPGTPPVMAVARRFAISCDEVRRILAAEKERRKELHADEIAAEEVARERNGTWTCTDDCCRELV